ELPRSVRRPDLGNPAHVAAFLADRTTMSLHVTRGIVAFAQCLQTHLPVFEAYSEGAVSKPAAQLIMRFLDDPPESMPADALARAAHTLIDYAGSSHHRELTAMIDGIRQHCTAAPADGTGHDGRGRTGDGHSLGTGPRPGAGAAPGGSGDGNGPGEDGTGSGCRSGLGPLRRRSDTFGGDDTTRNTLHIS